VEHHHHKACTTHTVITFIPNKQQLETDGKIYLNTVQRCEALLESESLVTIFSSVVKEAVPFSSLHPASTTISHAQI